MHYLSQRADCTLCLSSDIGDEFHYLFVCPYFHRERNLFLPKSIIARLIMLQCCHKPKKEVYSFNSFSTHLCVLVVVG